MIGVVVIAVGAVAFISLGRTRLSGSPNAQLAGWVSEANFATSSSVLNHDALELHHIIATHASVGARHTLCGAWANDAGTDNDNLPTPIAALTQTLAVSYGDFYNAAQLCYAAKGTDDQAMKRATGYSEKGLALLRKAIAEIEQRTQRSVDTTTSTTLIPETTTSML